ncbi:MAG: GNAT family N-acetyltransferase [Ruminiclostridium sp.]
MELSFNGLAAKPLRECDIDRVNSFCGKYLGEGLYSREMLEEISKKENHFFYVIYDKEEIAAIFYCYADTAENAFSDVTEKITDFCGEKERVGVCRSIAVAPPYRKTGLSLKLLKYFSAFLHNECGVDKIFVLAWVKGREIPAENILTAAGFLSAGRISRPWYKNEKLYCPLCGGRCKCDGELYFIHRE